MKLREMWNVSSQHIVAHHSVLFSPEHLRLRIVFTYLSSVWVTATLSSMTVRDLGIFAHLILSELFPQAKNHSRHKPNLMNREISYMQLYKYQGWLTL